MADCLIAFGANVGDPAASFELAVQGLQATAGVNVAAVGQPVTTRPIGGPADQPPFLNAAVRIETTLTAAELHQRLIAIENELGRERTDRWGPRKIDLDLLLYNQQSIQTTELIVPHPRMSFRRFVLEPAAEIAGDMVHPTSGLTIGQLVEHLDSRSDVVAWVSEKKQIPEPFDNLLNWLFVPVTALQQFADVEKDVKIVILEGGDSMDAALLHRARSFAGPLLDLAFASDVATEVVAALKACS